MTVQPLAALVGSSQPGCERNSDMQTDFEVYRDWLGITDSERPLTHYQLLRLKRFEDNPAKYSQRYRKMTGHVRKVATPEQAALAEQVIQELVRAMLCLADENRKKAYDLQLGRVEAAQPVRRSLIQILLEDKAVDAKILDNAREFAVALGLELRDALIQRKLVAQDVIMSAYAESVGLPFLRAVDIQADEALVGQVAPMLARQKSFVPLMIADDQLLLVSPFPIGPAVSEALLQQTGRLARTVLCTPQDMNILLRKYYSRTGPAAERVGAAQAKTAAVAVAAAPPTTAKAEQSRVAAGAIAEMQAAILQDEGAEPVSTPKAVAVAPEAPGAKMLRLGLSLAAFSLTVTAYEIVYVCYAFVHFAPFSMTTFGLGWVAAAVVALVTYLVAKRLT
jgi:Type II secretion system (T2SS), protein E, N-terminal domain